MRLAARPRALRALLALMSLFPVAVTDAKGAELPSLPPIPTVQQGELPDLATEPIVRGHEDEVFKLGKRSEGKPPTLDNHHDGVANNGYDYPLPPYYAAPVCEDEGARQIMPLLVVPPGYTPTTQDYTDIAVAIYSSTWYFAASAYQKSYDGSMVLPRYYCGQLPVLTYTGTLTQDGRVSFDQLKVWLHQLGGAYWPQVKFLMFSKMPPVEALKRGEATIKHDRRKTIWNLNNNPGTTYGPDYAVVYRVAWKELTVPHEILHMMGAVNSTGPSAYICPGCAENTPHATAGSHCWDGLDVMCYSDGTLGSGF